MILLKATCLVLSCDTASPQDDPFEERLLATIHENDQVERWRIDFAQNGRIVAYGANRGGQRYGHPFLSGGAWWEVIGNKRSEDFEEISGVSFNLEGDRWAFAARKQGEWSVWCDEKKISGGFSWVGRIIFRPDGILAYEAWQDGKAFLVVGEKKFDAYDGLYSTVFSRDGKTIAFAARQGDHWIVKVGDQSSVPFHQIGLGVVFSPQGNQVAFAARQGDRWSMHVGDKTGEPFEQIRGFPVFSPDGALVAYPVFDGVTERVVVGDRKEPGFDGVSDPAFSRDGTKLAYAVHVGGKKPGESHWSGGTECVIVDGKKGPLFSWIRPPIYFSPDASDVAYVAKVGEKYVVAIGDRKSEKFDYIGGDLQFSPDGKRLAFGALRGRELWWRVMNVRDK